MVIHFDLGFASVLDGMPGVQHVFLRVPTGAMPIWAECTPEAPPVFYTRDSYGELLRVSWKRGSK